MIDQDIVEEAVKVFDKGGVVIFPTDTVWGIGVAIKRMNALWRLYAIKGRGSDKPTAVLVDGIAMAMQLGRFTGKAAKLAQKHWPGGLTIIVRAREGAVPEIVGGGTSSVGLRVPNHQLILDIITKLGAGIVAGSANYAGAGAPRRYEMIDQRLLDAVDYVVRPSLEGAEMLSSEADRLIPSTVVDTTKKPFELLRQGSVKLTNSQ